MNTNTIFASIETDRAIDEILGNFDENYIATVINESLQYKFRPFNTRMPNFPNIINNNLNTVLSRAPSYMDRINQKKIDIFQNIINIICENYNLVIEQDIPDEHLYSICYLLYEIFVSEFTEKMINFFILYIRSNVSSLINMIPEGQKLNKSNYAKKIYTDQDYIVLYDNMNTVLDAVAQLDISFHDLLIYLSDPNCADFICSYISDTGDIYKYFYSMFILNPSTRTDMITSIKLKLVSETVQNDMITNPDQHPYFV